MIIENDLLFIFIVFGKHVFERQSIVRCQNRKKHIDFNLQISRRDQTKSFNQSINHKYDITGSMFCSRRFFKRFYIQME